MNKRQLSRYGEDLALKYIVKQGYHLREKNFRSKRYGELDLIVIDPSKKKLIVVEVKTRYVDTRVPPKEAVTDKKIYQLKRTTLFYKKQKGDKVPDALRIDVIAIELNRDDSIYKLEHIQNITQD